MRKAKAEQVFKAIREFYQSKGENIPEKAWCFRDHTHEGLSEGSWSLACEGYLDYDWPWLLGEELFMGNVDGLPDGVFLEPINGCTLGIHDDK